MKRHKMLIESKDGFYIASQDLKLRGPGDLFGIRQSGELAFELGDIFQDAGILQRASDWADKILSKDRELSSNEHMALKKRLEELMMRDVDFRTI